MKITCHKCGFYTKDFPFEKFAFGEVEKEVLLGITNFSDERTSTGVWLCERCQKKMTVKELSDLIKAKHV